MKAGAGKSKGNAKERELCRKFSMWISADERDDLVWRSASSGAVATIRSRSKMAKTKGDYRSQVGDLCSIDPLSSHFFDQVAIESKHYADLQLDNLVCNLPSKAAKFWTTHVELCQKALKAPWVVMKQNRKPDLLFVSRSFLVTIPDGCEVILRDIAIANFPQLGCSVYDLDDFLKSVSYFDLFGN